MGCVSELLLHCIYVQTVPCCPAFLSWCRLGFPCGRFYGQGRVAEHKFHNPQWVPGKLFVDSARRISFIWEDYNFLIRFKRLDLNELINPVGL